MAARLAEEHGRLDEPATADIAVEETFRLSCRWLDA
jgi:hypothetical protein